MKEKQIEASMKQETIMRQSMTVNELFGHFSYVFDAVNYYDEMTNAKNIARWDSGTDYDDFIAEYESIMSFRGAIQLLKTSCI